MCTIESAHARVGFTGRAVVNATLLSLLVGALLSRHGADTMMVACWGTFAVVRCSGARRWQIFGLLLFRKRGRRAS